MNALLACVPNYHISSDDVVDCELALVSRIVNGLAQLSKFFILSSSSTLEGFVLDRELVPRKLEFELIASTFGRFRMRKCSWKLACSKSSALRPSMLTLNLAVIEFHVDALTLVM